MLDVDPDGAGDLATEGGHVETDPARSVLSRKTLNLDLNPTLPGAIGYSNPTLDKLIQNRICGRFRFNHPLKPVWINGQDIAVPGKGTAESPSRVPEFARQLLALGKSRKARVITQDLAHPSEKRLGRLVSREDRATSYAINPPDAAVGVLRVPWRYFPFRGQHRTRQNQAELAGEAVLPPSPPRQRDSTSRRQGR